MEGGSSPATPFPMLASATTPGRGLVDARYDVSLQTMSLPPDLQLLQSIFPAVELTTLGEVLGDVANVIAAIEVLLEMTCQVSGQNKDTEELAMSLFRSFSSEVERELNVVPGFTLAATPQPDIEASRAIAAKRLAGVSRVQLCKAQPHRDGVSDFERQLTAIGLATAALAFPGAFADSKKQQQQQQQAPAPAPSATSDDRLVEGAKEVVSFTGIVGAVTDNIRVPNLDLGFCNTCAKARDGKSPRGTPRNVRMPASASQLGELEQYSPPATPPPALTSTSGNSDGAIQSWGGPSNWGQQLLPSAPPNPREAVAQLFETAFAEGHLGGAEGGDRIESSPQMGLRLTYSETTALWLSDVACQPDSADLSHLTSMCRDASHPFGILTHSFAVLFKQLHHITEPGTLPPIEDSLHARAYPPRHPRHPSLHPPPHLVTHPAPPTPPQPSATPHDTPRAPPLTHAHDHPPTLALPQCTPPRRPSASAHHACNLSFTMSSSPSRCSATRWRSPTRSRGPSSRRRCRRSRR